MRGTVTERLQRVAGKRTLRLTHYGRKSGRPHEVTIWFTVHGDKVYVGTADVNRHWVHNVKKTPHVKLAIAGERFEGEARFLIDPSERDRAMARVHRKYWMFMPLVWFGQLLITLKIVPYVPGTFEVTLSPS
jgi:deazaflavin-dependent oxidoreductase (nitroreductase family)